MIFGISFRSCALAIVCSAALLSACSTTPPPPPPLSSEVADSHVLQLPTGATYKVGNPYQIANVWYYPSENYSYSEEGVASWYGPNFHGKRTANGEIYNMNELTAAHPTLPMPSIVRVTNLENGRSVALRVNDRGPFKNDRVIDVSRRAAQMLGFYEAGTTRVRVDINAPESLNIKNLALGRNPGEMPTIISSPRGAVASSNLPPPPPTREVSSDVVQVPIAPKSVSTAAPKLPVAAVPADIPRGTIFVQAGAFSDESNALRLAHHLSEIGEAFVTTVIVDGSHYYRVRLGPFDDYTEAQELLAQVRSFGYDDAQVVNN